MTLHEAIEIVLNETGIPMTSSEVSKIINKRKLYSRQDKLPVPASQISARINNYPKIFSRESGKIKLVQDDIVSQKLQRYKNEISYMRGASTDSKIIIDALRDLENKSEDENEDLSILKEPSAPYFVEESISPYGDQKISDQDKFKIAYGLIDWFFSQNFRSGTKMSNQFISFFSKLQWFHNGNHNIIFSSYLSNYFLLKIAYQNPQSNFVLETSPNIDNQSKEFLEINNYVENLLSKKDNKKLSDLSTAIFIPPFLKGPEWNKICIKILSDLNFAKPNLDKAFIIMPSKTLSSRGKGECIFREKVVQSGYLDSVILFPSGMLENAGVSVAAFIFDFSKTNNEIFFLDATSIAPSQAAEIVNEKQHLSNISNTLSYKDIITNAMDLNPAVYVWESEDLALDPGYKLYTINDIVKELKTGIAIPRKNLYQDGELKVIRTSEINADSTYLNPKNVILGADHDEVRNIEKYLAKGGIILSGFNKKLKGNILPQNQSYVIGKDTYWVKLDNQTVLDEYFVREIQKEYVQKQLEQYSKGLAIMRLSKKDLLKIKINVPSSLETQKDFLLNEMQQKSIESQDLENEADLDFINTLEHSLRQPASSLGNDLLSFRSFIKNKIESGESLSREEPIVPVFETDTPEQIAIHSVTNTLERMQRMVTDIGYILTQAGSLAQAKASPILELIELNPFFNNFVAENQDIQMVISGNAEIIADRKQMRILFNNLIANARKHGFGKDRESPTIWIEVISNDKSQIQISIKNNGKKLPPEFTTEDFIAKGKSSNEDVGSGFGGFLIGQILQNHNGKIELVKEDFRLLEHNVEFLITLPI